MKLLLTPTERKALAHLELAAEVPLSEVARAMGVRQHTLRYTLDRLRSRGIVSKRPFINIYPLGFADYAIYFSLAPEQEQHAARLIQSLTQSDRVSWLATFGGDYHYGMAISAHTAAEVQTFLEEISARYPAIFYRKSLSVRTALTLFPRKYLGGQQAHANVLRFGYTAAHQTIKIDEKDHSILHALEETPNASLRDLSSNLRIPLTTLQQRVASLKKSGVLMGSLYQIDATKFGAQPFRLLVEAKSVSKQLRERLYAYCQSHPAICYLIECLGAWDYEIGIEVTRGEEAIEITQSIHHQFLGDLAGVQILPLFGHAKIRNYPFTTALQAK